MIVWKAWHISILIAAIAGPVGCLALVGFEDNYGLQDTNPGAGAGSGGEDGAFGGGGGSCPDAECCDLSTCSQPEEVCAFATCTNGRCKKELVSDGTPSPWDSNLGDCKIHLCREDGAAVLVTNHEDPLDDGNDCTEDGCNDAGPLNIPVTPGKGCSQNGGVYCNSAAKCVKCIKDAHCWPGLFCAPKGSCLPLHCRDGQKNTEETDVDCGGACSGTCEPGQACQVHADCMEGLCLSSVCRRFPL